MVHSHNLGWVKEHERLAKEILFTVQIPSQAKNQLLQLPTNPIEWIKTARPIVEGRERSFVSVPFWEEI